MSFPLFSRLIKAASSVLFLALAGAGISGCSSISKITSNDAKGGKLFAVSADKTPFYRYGPQQGNGPDESLPKDTLMTLIRPSFGYCKVQLVAGSKEGYVASEDIKPAPPTLVASLTKPVATPEASSVENFDMHSSEPPPPETLPDPDLPPAADAPAPAATPPLP